MERLGRNVSVPGAYEIWMDSLSAVGVVLQYGIDPNVALTPEGKFEIPGGEAYIFASSDSSAYSSGSYESVSDLHQSGRRAADEKKLLKLKLAAKIKKRAEACRRGAVLASKRRILTMPNAAW